MSYQPLHFGTTYHIEGYRLYGPVIDGLLIAREIVEDYGSYVIVDQIDAQIEHAKQAYIREKRK